MRPMCCYAPQGRTQVARSVVRRYWPGKRCAYCNEPEPTFYVAELREQDPELCDDCWGVRFGVAVSLGSKDEFDTEAFKIWLCRPIFTGDTFSG